MAWTAETISCMVSLDGIRAVVSFSDGVNKTLKGQYLVGSNTDLTKAIDAYLVKLNSYASESAKISVSAEK